MPAVKVPDLIKGIVLLPVLAVVLSGAIASFARAENLEIPGTTSTEPEPYDPCISYGDPNYDETACGPFDGDPTTEPDPETEVPCEAEDTQPTLD